MGSRARLIRRKINMARKNYVLDPGPIQLLSPAKVPLREYERDGAGEIVKVDGEPVMKPFVFTMKRFILEHILGDTQFNKSRATAKRARDIEKIFEAGHDPRFAKPCFELDGSDWDLLKACVEEPSHAVGDARGNSFQPFIWQQLLPYADAICEAMDKAPEEVAKNHVAEVAPS